MAGSIVRRILEHTNLPCPIAYIIGDFCIPTVFQGHTYPVLSLAISPGSKYLYSGSYDNTIRQWSIETGQCLQKFKGHTHSVACLAVSSDNKYLYSGSYDTTVRQWSIETGQCLQSFKGHAHWVLSLVVSSDNKYLYSGSADGAIRQWAIGDEPTGSSIEDPLGPARGTGRCLQSFQGHTHWVRSLVISSDNKYLYSGSYDKTIRQWAITGQCLQRFQGHTESVLSLVVSSDNKYLFSGSDDKTIRQWAIGDEPTSSSIEDPLGPARSTRQCLQIFQGHTEWVRSLSISPDNKYLYSGSDDGTIYRWTLSNPENPTIYKLNHPVYALHCTSTSLFYSQGEQIHRMLCCPFLDQSIN